MRIFGVGLSLLVVPLMAFGQMDDNTITVTLSSNATTVQPDQVAFSIAANFEPTAGLDDVLQALQSAGITPADFIDVHGYSLQAGSGSVPTNQWSFQSGVALSKLNDKLSALLALQQTIGKNPSRSFSFSLGGVSFSPQLQSTSTCPYGAIFLGVGAQAQAIAAAAGFMLGPIVSITDGTPAFATPIAVNGNTSPSGANFFGAPSGISLINQILTVPQFGPFGCTMSVQFKLVH